MGILKDLETFILPPNLLTSRGVPSISIALLEETNKITSHVITSPGGGGGGSGSGSSDDDAPPPTPSTLYQACSVSKAVTALAVAKLIDSSTLPVPSPSSTQPPSNDPLFFSSPLSYSTLISPYIPASISQILSHPSPHSSDPALPQDLLQHVTVAHLLSHTSGLSQHEVLGYPFPSTLPSHAQTFSGALPANNPRIRFKSLPGAQFSYSGGGYTLLEVFLENFLGGEKFEGMMERVLLRPLGMERSTFRELGEGERDYAEAHWTDQHKGNGNENGYSVFPKAAAGLWTTPTELLKIVRAIQGALDGDEGAFLKKETVKKMLEVKGDGGGMGMAMGWMVNGMGFAHSGDNRPGYVSYVFGTHGGAVKGGKGSEDAAASRALRTQARTGMAVMANSCVGFEACKRVVAAVFALKDWLRSPPPGMPLPGLETFDFVPYPAPEGILLKPGFWREWVGKWDGGWEIMHDDCEGLEVAFGDALAPMRLRPGATPVRLIEGTWEMTMVVEGLDIALRLTVDVETSEQVLMLIQDKVKRLRRVGQET